MAWDQARFEVFRGTLASWQTLFSEAAAFATSIGRDHLISISHTEDQNEGVVTVWYWAEDTGTAEPADDWIRDGEEAAEWKPGEQQETK